MQPTPAHAPIPTRLALPVLGSFKAVRKAMDNQAYAHVERLGQFFLRKFPAYAGYYQEILGQMCAEQQDTTTARQWLMAANDFFCGQSVPTLRLLLEILCDHNAFDDAERLLKQGLRDHPTSVVLRLEAAKLLYARGHIHEAIAALPPLCSDDTTSMARYLLADYCFEVGRYEESMKIFAACLGANPLDAAWINWLFLAHYVPHFDADQLRAMIAQWFEIECRPLPPTDPARLVRERDPHKRLRVGLLSSGLQRHPAGWMTVFTLCILARSGEVELIVYNTNQRVPQDDPVRNLLLPCMAQWHDAGHWSEAKLYERMLHDELDVAVDMAGHADGSRLKLFARRIAPVQVKWVGGLFDTTGVPTMDYLFTDAHQTPAGVDAHYAEHLVRLPHGYVTYVPPDYAPDVVSPPHTATGYITFGSFNNAYKINPVLAGVWSGILHRVPGSRLLLKAAGLERDEISQHVLNLFAAHGIEPERISIEGRSSHADLLACYNRVDIALDTWPYTGGLTTLEALWMGVPVITTPGPSFAGRHATTHLHNVGLEEFVADSFDAYAELAVELANNFEVLADLRSLLRQRMVQSPITDHAQLAADVLTALRAMWQRHCDELPPMAMRFEQPSPVPAGWQTLLQQQSPTIPMVEADPHTTAAAQLTAFVTHHLQQAVTPLEDNAAACAQVEGWLADTSSKQAYRRELVFVPLRDIMGSEVALAHAGALPAPQWQAACQALQRAQDQGVVPHVHTTLPDDHPLLRYMQVTTFIINQYQYQDKVTIRDGDVVLDCGACFGESSLWAGMQGAARAYAFEPNPDSLRMVQANARAYAQAGQEPWIVPVPLALADHEGTLHFAANADHPGASCAQKNGGIEVPCTTLDAWCAAHQVRPHFIKMDLEGGEVQAIAGAEQVFRTHGPRFAICLYHRLSDMWIIPQMLRRFRPDYRFWCRKNALGAEFVLYGCAASDLR